MYFKCLFRRSWGSEIKSNYKFNGNKFALFHLVSCFHTPAPTASRLVKTSNSWNKAILYCHWIYRVFHSGVDWHITYNISETYVCIKTKFCTCVHELFTSNFCFNNFFLRPLTLAVLIRYYVHFDDFLKAFYVFLKFSPFWYCPRIFRYFIGCKLIFFDLYVD